MKVGATDSLPLSYLPPFISLILVNVTTGSRAAKLDTPEPFSTLSGPPFQGPVIKCPPEGLVATFNTQPIGSGCFHSPSRAAGYHGSRERCAEVPGHFSLKIYSTRLSGSPGVPASQSSHREVVAPTALPFHRKKSHERAQSLPPLPCGTMLFGVMF